MMKRLTIALCAVLGLVGPVLSQTPPGTDPVQPPVKGINGPVAPLIPPMADLVPAGSTGQFWVTGDYLFAWMRGDNVPALVTTSPAGTPRNFAGVPGGSSTSVLYGGTVNDNLRMGFKL